MSNPLYPSHSSFSLALRLLLQSTSCVFFIILAFPSWASLLKMARAGRPKRGKTAALQGSSRNRAPAESLVPEVYQEMLSNATLSSPSLLSDEGQSIKRRRVGGNIVVQGVGSSIPVRWDAESEVEADSERLALSRIPKVVTQQTAYNDSEDSADSEMEWEEVDLRDKAIIEEARDEVRELELTLGGDTRTSEKATIQRRRPITSVDRSLRLEIHKMHVLTLLAHIHLRNHWCNDVEIQVPLRIPMFTTTADSQQRVLRSLLSKKTRAYLDDDETQSQFQRSRSFMDGVGQAAETFRNRYKISARGMSRSYWAEDAEALAQVGILLSFCFCYSVAKALKCCVATIPHSDLLTRV